MIKSYQCLICFESVTVCSQKRTGHSNYEHFYTNQWEGILKQVYAIDIFLFIFNSTS